MTLNINITKSEIAEFVSYMFPFLLVLTLIIIMDDDIFKLIELAIIPCVMWIAFAKLGGQTWDIEDRKHRIVPLVVLVIYGLIITYVVNDFFSKVFFINIVFILLITSFWKISMHCYGLSTLIMLLVYMLKYTDTNFYLLLFLITSYTAFLILTIWSRLYLKKHTVLQVAIGTFFGFLINMIIIQSP